MTIQLTNDSFVEGELVKSNLGEVFVDLGFDILKIQQKSKRDFLLSDTRITPRVDC